jgi:predicted DNA-binding transcriptional regulator AlpA
VGYVAALEVSEMSMTNEEDRVREMLTLTQVLSMIPFDRTFLFRMENDGLCPQGHFVSARKKLWFRDEVSRWQRDLQDPNSELSKAVRARLSKTKGQ